MIGAGWTALFGVMQALDPVFELVTQADGSVLEYPIWPIRADEAAKLGTASAAQLTMLPAAQRKAVAKFLNAYAPSIILVATIYEIGAPRYRFSAAVRKAQRASTVAPSAPASSPNGATHHAGPGAAGAAGGPAGPIPAAPKQRPDPAGTGAPANAGANGVAAAFQSDAGLG